MEFFNLLFIFCTIILHTGFRLKIERRVYKYKLHFQLYKFGLRVKKEPKITVWIDRYKSPSPLVPPFSLFKEHFSK